MTKEMTTFLKVRKVIESCETMKQYWSARIYASFYLDTTTDFFYHKEIDACLNVVFHKLQDNETYSIPKD